jgi:hypothetical protein
MTDDDHKGVVASITAFGETAVRSVPAGFLLLCALNVIFICGLLWFLNNQSAGRERVIAQILSACLEKDLK